MQVCMRAEPESNTCLCQVQNGLSRPDNVRDNVQREVLMSTCNCDTSACRYCDDVVTIIPPSGSQLVKSGEVLDETSLLTRLRCEMAECDEAKVNTDSFQKGSLKVNISFWKDELEAPDPIIKIIEHGYVLPLKSEPTPHVQINHHSAINNSSFVQESLAELTALGCVIEVPHLPHVCSPLSVVENSVGKKRLVINLRHLNRFLWKQKFKYEDLRIAMLLLSKGDFMFSFDLKSGYHHVDISKEHWKYLGFTWQEKFYVFTVLPFGLSTACYVFTKLMRVL